MWHLEHRHGTVSELLEMPEPGCDRLVARVHCVSHPALVLGSSQSLSVVDAARAEAAGVEVVTRRSGGGAVLIAPLCQVWVDFFVPAGERLWEDDVVKAAMWAGELWAAAADSFTVETPAVHSGGLDADQWGKLVCFAGIGPGEVQIAGRKAVGVSQRRNRRRIRIQTAAIVSPLTDPRSAASADMGEVFRPSGSDPGGEWLFRPDKLDELGLLALTSGQRSEGRAALAERCGAISADAVSVEEALLDMLGVC